MKELKRSGYAPVTAVLGSRDQLCSNSKVSKLAGTGKINNACKFEVKRRGCGAKLELDKWIEKGGKLSQLSSSAESRILDIEDLGRVVGKEMRMCPYFLPRTDSVLAEAELLVVPYNYLLEPSVREATLRGVDLRNSCVIFDEAHNLEEVACESASFDLPPSILARAQLEIKDALKGAIEGQKKAMEEARQESNGSGRGAYTTSSRLEELAEEARAEYDRTLGFTIPNARALYCAINMLESRIYTGIEKMAEKKPLETIQGGPGADAFAAASLSALPPQSSSSGRAAGNGGNSGTVGVTLPCGSRLEAGHYVFELLNHANITHSNFSKAVTVIEQISSFLSRRDIIAPLPTASAGGASQSWAKVDSAGGKGSYALESFATFLQRVFRAVPDPSNPGGVSDSSRHFRIVLSNAPHPTGGGGSGGKTLSYWCFSPSVAMQELKALGVRSFVLASGTLTPMASFATELGLPFPIRLSGKHVVDPASQVCCGVVLSGDVGTSGPVSLNGSYENRENPEYKMALGAQLSTVAGGTPGGVLVFFPSYSVMEKTVEFWKTCRVWESLTGSGSSLPNRPVFLEPRSASEFPALLAGFNAACDRPDGRGALLFAVCKGKVSEGLDFADARGRAVVIVGIPYAPPNDARVVIKRRLLDESYRAAGGGGGGRGNFTGNARFPTTTILGAGGGKPVGPPLSGASWYSMMAMRAVNQAAGRVIRHGRDYGAIIFLDERFAREKESLSPWFRGCLQTWETGGRALSSKLQQFFKAAEVEFSKPPPLVINAGIPRRGLQKLEYEVGGAPPGMVGKREREEDEDAVHKKKNISCLAHEYGQFSGPLTGGNKFGIRAGLSGSGPKPPPPPPPLPLSAQITANGGGVASVDEKAVIRRKLETLLAEAEAACSAGARDALRAALKALHGSLSPLFSGSKRASNDDDSLENKGKEKSGSGGALDSYAVKKQLHNGSQSSVIKEALEAYVSAVRVACLEKKQQEGGDGGLRGRGGEGESASSTVDKIAEGMLQFLPPQLREEGKALLMKSTRDEKRVD